MKERFAADFLNRLPLMSFILGLPQIRFTLIHTYYIRCVHSINTETELETTISIIPMKQTHGSDQVVKFVFIGC